MSKMKNHETSTKNKNVQKIRLIFEDSIFLFFMLKLNYNGTDFIYNKQK